MEKQTINGKATSSETAYDPQAAEITRRRYQRNTRFYDLTEGSAEKRHGPWRKKLWSMVKGPKVLEVGVGTGKNIPCYPDGIEITAFDLPPGMLERAKVYAQELGKPIIGKIMDQLNSLVVRMMGANINRRTVENVRRSGLEIVQIEDLGGGGIFKKIVARRPLGTAQF